MADIVDKTSTGVDSHQGEAFSLALVVGERTSNDREKICRDAVRFAKEHLLLIGGFRVCFVSEQTGCLRASFLESCTCLVTNFGFVRNDGPIAFGDALKAPGGLEVRLVEAREDVMAVVSLELGVEVLLGVHLVNEGMQANTIFAVLVDKEELNSVGLTDFQHA